MMHGHEESDSAMVVVKQRDFFWGISDDKIATLRERRDSLRQMTA
jgi:hypothetical protein